MSELGHGWKAGILAATVIAIGIGCGGDTASPPTTTLGPSTTIAPPPPSTAPAAPPPTTVPNAAVVPGTPHAVPAVDIARGAELVSLSNVRWKDKDQRQVAADVRLLKGPIQSLLFAFQANGKLVGGGILLGNALSAKEAVTVYLPASMGKDAKGKERLPDISNADRLVIHAFGLPADTAARGQPAWTAPLVTACEQDSATDCQTLATAYRTGSSDKGTVTPDAALAERFSKRFIETGSRNCAMGAPENCFVLGRAYLTGEDVPANPNLGVALVQKACAAGVDAACSFQTGNPAFEAQPR